VESLGYPERVRGIGISVVATCTFQAGCMYDCGSILLDRVSLVCQVVEFVGACAAMLPTNSTTCQTKDTRSKRILPQSYIQRA